jgi:hypothetical protein
MLVMPTEDAKKTICLVTQDEGVRLAAARAFDAAPEEWRLELHSSAPSGAEHIVYGPDCPRELTPRFDPVDAASLLPSVSGSIAGDPSVFAVVAPTGGAGVTTVAVHLAAALSSRHDTVLIEPPGVRAASARMRVPEEAAVWQAGEPVTVTVPVAGGFRLLRAAELGAAKEAVTTSGVAGVADIGRARIDEIAPSLRAVVVVVTPSRPGALLTRSLLRDLPDLDRVIVTNRTGHGGEMTPSKVAEVIGAPVALDFPCSPSLRAAEDSGKLVTQPWSRWWRAMSHLATTLEAAWIS